MINIIKRIPGVRFLSELKVFSLPYHFLMGFLGALWYGFPSRRLIVIGVTGTKGKTTTSNLLWHILTSAGYTTGLATTVNMRIGKKEFINTAKQTMLGRFQLQRLLRDMVRAGCTYAVIETSSWGIVQYRHRFIDYSAAVITNITPEHIEQHGGFENYRAAKRALFARVARHRGGIGIYNLDDENVGYFLKVHMPIRYGYSVRGKHHIHGIDGSRVFHASNIYLGDDHVDFSVNGAGVSAPLVGEFNVYNATAAIAGACALGVQIKAACAALANPPLIPGRMEMVERGGVRVIVDYAHEPTSLEAAYTAARALKPKKLIGVLGAQGGGRDKWKRATMGRIAARYLSHIILTNEDPYDEDPARIIDDIELGVYEEFERGARVDIMKIIDREEAIHKAVALANPGDVVVLSGKGGEVWMCVEKNMRIAWDEKRIAEEALCVRFGKDRKIL